MALWRLRVRAACNAIALAGLILLAFQGCAPSEVQNASAANVTVHAPPVRTRDFEDRFIRLNYDLMLTQDGNAAGTTDGTWSIDEQRQLTVLATHDNVVSELQVKYADQRGGPLLGVVKHTSTDGNTYVVRATDSGPSISRADGRQISEAERAAVAAEYGDVGQPSPLLSLLAKEKLEPGALLVPSSEAVRALLGAPPDVDVQGANVALRFAGFKNGGRPLAELTVTVKGQLSNGEAVFDLNLSGPARVDLKTGFVDSLRLKGKVRAHGRYLHGQLWYDVSGAGTAVITRNSGLG